MFGGDTDSTVTTSPFDRLETKPVWVAHRAIALTVNIPPAVQILEALMVPTGNQSEFVPSPQSKKY
jgi:hypothetical protein